MAMETPQEKTLWDFIQNQENNDEILNKINTLNISVSHGSFYISHQNMQHKFKIYSNSYNSNHAKNYTCEVLGNILVIAGGEEKSHIAETKNEEFFIVVPQCFSNTELSLYGTVKVEIIDLYFPDLNIDLRDRSTLVVNHLKNPKTSLKIQGEATCSCKKVESSTLEVCMLGGKLTIENLETSDKTRINVIDLLKSEFEDYFHYLKNIAEFKIDKNSFIEAAGLSYEETRPKKPQVAPIAQKDNFQGATNNALLFSKNTNKTITAPPNYWDTGKKLLDYTNWDTSKKLLDYTNIAVSTNLNKVFDQSAKYIEEIDKQAMQYSINTRDSIYGWPRKPTKNTTTIPIKNTTPIKKKKKKREFFNEPEKVVPYCSPILDITDILTKKIDINLWGSSIKIHKLKAEKFSCVLRKSSALIIDDLEDCERALFKLNNDGKILVNHATAVTVEFIASDWPKYSNNARREPDIKIYSNYITNLIIYASGNKKVQVKGHINQAHLYAEDASEIDVETCLKAKTFLEDEFATIKVKNPMGDMQISNRFTPLAHYSREIENEKT